MACTYDIDQWLDYLRGAIEGPLRRAMRGHLITGCEPCRRKVELLACVATAGEHEVASCPPEDAVRSAKGAARRRRIYQSSAPRTLLGLKAAGAGGTPGCPGRDA